MKLKKKLISFLIKDIGLIINVVNSEFNNDGKSITIKIPIDSFKERTIESGPITYTFTKGIAGFKIQD